MTTNKYLNEYKHLSEQQLQQLGKQYYNKITQKKFTGTEKAWIIGSSLLMGGISYLAENWMLKNKIDDTNRMNREMYEINLEHEEITQEWNEMLYRVQNMFNPHAHESTYYYRPPPPPPPAPVEATSTDRAENIAISAAFSGLAAFGVAGHFRQQDKLRLSAINSILKERKAARAPVKAPLRPSPQAPHVPTQYPIITPVRADRYRYTQPAPSEQRGR